MANSSRTGTMPHTFLQDIAHYPVDPPKKAEPGAAATPPPAAPLDPVRVAVRAPDGALWIGGPHGAARKDGGEWRCFWGRRWLPGNAVREIRFHGRDIYLNTDRGWSRIRRRAMTFEEKAAHYQRLTEARHTRRGFVAKCLLLPGEDPGHRHRAVDNDGLWTALYCAAQVFRRAATGSRAAKARASESMSALLELERMTGIQGFPARSVIRPDETDIIRTAGEWHDSPVEPGVLWKGDTSSDELSGHFFAWYVYWRYAPGPRERPRIAQACARTLDHLLANGLRLIDLDGKPTEWGDFSPESLNRDPAWSCERGLNSLCILSFLAVGSLLTGDPRYRAKYRELIDEHGYLDNAMGQKMLPPFELNHSDDQLAFLAFYCLLHILEPGKERDRLERTLRKSLDLERAERCPLYNLIACSVFRDEAALEDARLTLREWPWDLRDWECRNSHRRDVEYDPEPDRFGRRQTVTVISPAERPVYRWNSNPFVADGGGDGTMEEDGAAWLLAYWLGRFHGLLSP